MNRPVDLDCLKGRKADHLRRTTIPVATGKEIHTIDNKEEVAEEGNYHRPSQVEDRPVDLAVCHLDRLLCLLRDPHLRVTEDLID
jgi:hypothetical protein